MEIIKYYIKGAIFGFKEKKPFVKDEIIKLGAIFSGISALAYIMLNYNRFNSRLGKASSKLAEIGIGLEELIPKATAGDYIKWALIGFICTALALFAAYESVSILSIKYKDYFSEENWNFIITIQIGFIFTEACVSLIVGLVSFISIVLSSVIMVIPMIYIVYILFKNLQTVFDIKNKQHVKIIAIMFVIQLVIVCLIPNIIS